MNTILKLNSISKAALPVLSDYNVADTADNPVGILVRSFNMSEYAVPASLLAVARAGAGVNNIPHADYAKAGICVFNTPGANSNAVKELVVAAMLTGARNLFEGVSWANTLTGDVAKQVEKGKSAFAGTEITGKTLAVLGLGAIGRKVAKAADALGMNVVGYDPYISSSAKEEIPFVTVVSNPASAYAVADFVTLHMPYTPDTKEMVNADAVAKMKDGVIIINAARGELVDNAAVKAAVTSGKVRKYFVDFPSEETVNVKGITAVPHLGASTEEAEDNCAVMAAEELKDYIENGNVRNSVNMPSISVPKTKAHRVTIVSTEGTALPLAGASATKNGIAYTIVDSDSIIDVSLIKTEGIIKIRSVY